MDITIQLNEMQANALTELLPLAKSQGIKDIAALAKKAVVAFIIQNKQTQIAHELQ
jgi:hypothetical protein